MKTFKNNLFAQVLAATAVLLIVGGVAYAANSPGAVTTSSPIITPVDPQATTTIEQRVAQRRAAARVQQNAARTQQILAKCSLAQSAVGQIRSKDTKTRVLRNQAYTSLATRLNRVVINLGNQGVNASELFARQKEFNNAVNKYLATAMDYKTAVDDLVNMDCQQDPAGFEATLILVRTLRTQLSIDATAIRDQLPALVDSLQAVKRELKPVSSGGRN